MRSLKPVVKYIAWLLQWLRWIKIVVTRIVAGLEAMTGGMGRYVKPLQWFSVQQNGVINGVVWIQTSDVLADKTIIRKVKIFAGNRIIGIDIHELINVFITTDPAPPAAIINDQEPVIVFNSYNYPNLITVAGDPVNLEWECRKIITGSNKRIGVAIRGFGLGLDVVRIHVLYEEP